jgi:hypothetical protein
MKFRQGQEKEPDEEESLLEPELEDTEDHYCPVNG